MPTEVQQGGGSETENTLLDGRVRLLQPVDGYRVAIDPVLLAAALPPAVRKVADIGCGTGAAMLCLMARLAEPEVCGLELQADIADLARRSLALNGWSGRGQVITGNLLRRPPLLPGNGFDAVMTNPPYHGPGNRSPDEARAIARMEAVPLADWLGGCLRCLKPRGVLAVVYRADRLDSLLAALVAGKAGSVEVFPLWPKAGDPARRVVVRAIKGGRAPLVLHPGLVLHGAGGAFTPQAEAVLRHGLGLAEAVQAV